MYQDNKFSKVIKIPESDQGMLPEYRRHLEDVASRYGARDVELEELRSVPVNGHLDFTFSGGINSASDYDQMVSDLRQSAQKSPS